MASILERLRGEKVGRTREQPLIPYLPTLETSPRPTSSMAYEYLLETTKQMPQPKSLSLAWAEGESQGLGSARHLTEFERKEMCWLAYLDNPWVSSAIDAQVKRMTSGGWAITEVEKDMGKPQELDTLKGFFGYINDDEDFSEHIRSIGTDLGIFGEAYDEIIWDNGEPVSLVKIDCMTITYDMDSHGRITGYTQKLPNSTTKLHLEPEQVIRWWYPSPRAHKQALSPIERVKNAIYADTAMVKWMEGFFKRGAKPPFWIETEGTKEDLETYWEWMLANLAGVNNAHIPWATYGGAKLHEYNKGSIDIDFQHGRDRNRTEILAGYGVPPAAVSVIESGNLGGGTGESQEKSLQYNTVDPLRQKIMEKINYRVVQQGFKIAGWIIDTRYADYRLDSEISKIQDTRVRSGISTQNEEREGMGKHPYKNMGDVPVLVASKDVLPLPRLEKIDAEMTTSAQLDIEAKQQQNELAKVQVDKAKNPDPVPAPLQAIAPSKQQQDTPPEGVPTA